MKKQQPQVLHPNFGQHTPAIDELLKRLSETMRYRDLTQKTADQYRDRLHEEEQRLISHNRAIESYKGAIRALGGKVPDELKHAPDPAA
jgi:hypothetical protein